MARSRRGAFLFAVLLGLVVLTAAPSLAHALPIRTQPVNGSVLTTSPQQIVMTFAERADPTLSFIHVLNPAGQRVERGASSPVPGQPLDLRVAVPNLPNGVYTVTWRTVSRVDGHVTAGSFTFGIGQSPGKGTAGGALTSSSPTPPPLAVAGRWALYVGTALLLGGAVVGLTAFGRDALRSVRGTAMALLGTGWVLAAAGLVMTVVAERSSVGVSYGALFASTTGRDLGREAIGVALTGGATAAVMWWPRRVTLWVLAAATAMAMLLHVLNGHAAASSHLTWANIGVQWLHLLSVGVWVGGLPWLLLILRRRPAEERSASAHLFSRIAAVTLATVAVTGLLRAISELGGVGAWRRLFDTSFGVTLCIKVALFVGLVALGARNHYVNVPRLRHDAGKVGPLRRSVRTEIVLAAAIFVATGFLSGLPPASSLAQTAGRASPPARLVVNGSDFATTVRIRLIVSPGTVGPNRFEAHVVDDDSGKPVPADEVALMFSNPSRPNLGTRRLSLAPAGSGDGVWAAQGMDLSLLGRWNISVLVDGSTSTVTVPLTLQTRVPPDAAPLR
ncbi:MAG TPA: hypothetical protein DIT48_05500 [Actinobacteria bacterium]|jgi:copper transport protein|nr:hypothetical protein [Actinomycetota bacterium]